ncbi:unnamed protein product [Lampetra fluviatilis]
MALVPELAESHNARQSPKAKWCQLQERLHDAVAQLALLRKNHPPQEPSSATSTPTGDCANREAKRRAPRRAPRRNDMPPLPAVGKGSLALRFMCAGATGNAASRRSCALQ